MKLLHRTLDHVQVPPIPVTVTPDFRVAIGTGVLAIASLVVAGFGDIHSSAVLHRRVMAGAGAVGFLVFAVLAIRSTANEIFRVISARTGPSHASVIRWGIMLAGYAVVLLAALDLLAIPVQHLILGGALTGVIIGIAAQQALGNVFAGVVLLLARPFSVGSDVRIRSGALGGEFSGRVTGMGLTYVTVETDDGPLSVPNSQMLAAGIGPARLRYDGA